MGKRQSSFQQVLLGNLDSCMQINETRTHPHTMHQNKLKMAERLKHKTRHHQIFSDIDLTNVFSGQSPKATEIKAKINQWDLIKLTVFSQQKKTKRQLTEWEKIVSNDAIHKGLLSKTYKQLIQLDSKKAQQPNGKMGKRPECTFLQRRCTDGKQAPETMLNIPDY